MPSNQVLGEKQQIVVDLTTKLKNAASGVLVDYKGISVADDTALRKEFREAGVDYCVVKNTLLTFAAKEAGLEDLKVYLEGTTALALSQGDAIAPAKIAAKYSDKLKEVFNIKAGFMDGAILDAEKMTAVGKLPSKDQLVGQLLSVLTADLRGMAFAINTIAEQKAQG